MACQLAANLIKNIKVESSQLGSQLSSQLDSHLYSQLYGQLYSHISSHLDSQLSSQLNNQLSSQKLEYFNFPINLWWWAGWSVFYDYLLNVVFPKKKKEFKLYLEFLEHWKELPYYLAFDSIVFISENPVKLTINKQYQLHDENDAALKYKDGYGVYSLNGILVPELVIKTKKEDFTSDMILKEKNADIRREIIRKIGMTKVSELLKAKVLDKMDDYELLSFDIGDGRVRPYLKMINPSVGCVHIEGVLPSITTVKGALAWRNGMTEYVKPKELT
jgi:hypothetical protein